MHRSSTVYNENSLDFDLRGQQGMDVYTGGSVIMDYEQVF